MIRRRDKMAKSKVTLEVIVEGKNVKIVQRDVENLAKSTNKAAKGLDKSSKSAEENYRNLEGVAKNSSSATKNFSKMSQGITSGLVPAYATLAANLFAVTAAFRFFRSAADFVVLQKGQEAFASATGVALRSLSRDIIAATDSQIKFADASQAAAIGTAAGLNPDQLTRLGSAAKDVSIILGRDVTDSFNRLVRGVTKAEPELLDELGIVLRLKDATEAYALSLGKNATELTAFERSQAVANDVLTQAEDKYGRILAVVEPQPNALNQLAVSFDNLLNTVKEFTAFVIGPFVRALDQFPALGVALLGIFGKGVLTAAIPGLKNLGETAREAAMQSKLNFDKASASLKKYELAVAPVIARQKALSRLQRLASAKDTDPGFKGAAVKLIKRGDGERLTAKQINVLRNDIENTKKISGEIRQKWLADLQVMAVTTKTTGKQIERSFLGIRQWAVLQFKGIQVAWTSTMAAMRSAMVGLATAASFALSALGWLSLVGTLGAVVYQFFKAEEQVDETTKALDYQTGKLKSLNEEFKNFNEVQRIITEDGQGMLGYLTALGTRIGQLDLSSLSETFTLSTESSSSFDAFAVEAEKTFDRLAGSGGTFWERLLDAPGRALTGMRGISELQRLQDELLLEVSIGGSEKTIDNLNKQISALEGEIKKTELTFGNFLNTSEDQRLKELGQYFSDQAANLELMNKNFGEGAGSTAIREYLDLIQQVLDAGSVEAARNIFESNELQKKQAQVQEITASYKSYTKSVEDNARLVGQIRASFLPISQNLQAITALELEAEQLNKIRADIGKLSVEEEAALATRIKQRELDLELAKGLEDIDQRRVQREQELKILTETRLRGATKLQSDLIKRGLELNAIENDRKNILDQLGLVYNQVQSRGTEVLRHEWQRIDALLQQLDLLKEQEISLQRQGEYSAQLVDTINDSFESGFASGLEKLINNTEGSLKDSIRTLALGVLNSLAGTLARQITETLFKVDFTTRLMAAFDYGAAKISEAIRGTATLANQEGSPVNKASNFLLGDKTPATVNIEGDQALATTPANQPVVRTGGIFSQFINSIQGLFNPDTPFLQKLSDIFDGAKDSFGRIFRAIFSGIGQAGTGAFGILGTIATSFFANGGIMPGGMRAYADGGIATRPTMGVIGEGRYNEAVVPLPSGNEIPVKLQGASSQQNNISVNVNIDNKGNATSDAPQLNNLGGAIARAVQQELQNQKRPGGILNRYGAT